MKPILTFLSLLLSLQCFAQYDTMGSRLVRKQPRQYTAVKWSPASVGELNNHNITLALEHRFNVKNSVQLQGAYTLPFRYPINGPFAANGYKVRMEYRRYFRQKPLNTDWFYGVEAFYTRNNIPEVEYFRDTITNQVVGDNFVLHKKMYGGAVKFGVQRRFGKHFIVEAYTGFGIKHRNIYATGRADDLQPQLVEARGSVLAAASHYTGISNTVVLPSNVFIGYYFH